MVTAIDFGFHGGGFRGMGEKKVRIRKGEGGGKEEEKSSGGELTFGVHLAVGSR